MTSPVAIDGIGDVERWPMGWVGSGELLIGNEHFPWSIDDGEDDGISPATHPAIDDLRAMLADQERWQQILDDGLDQLGEQIVAMLKSQADAYQQAQIDELEQLLAGDSVSAYMRRCRDAGTTDEALYQHYASLVHEIDELRSANPITELPTTLPEFRASLEPRFLVLTEVMALDGMEDGGEPAPTPAVALTWTADWLEPRAVIALCIDGELVQLDIEDDEENEDEDDDEDVMPGFEPA